MNDSIFTKIINREIPAKIEYEDDEFIAIHDINPSAPVHILVVPKRSPETLEGIDITDESFHGKLLITARKVAHQAGIGDNYKLLMNVGKQVQQIHHIHLHVLGGWDKNKSTEELDAESRKFIGKHG